MTTSLRIKTVALFASLAAIAALSLGVLTSCGNNDAAFVGTWTTSAELNGVPTDYTITFNDNHEGTYNVAISGELAKLIQDAGGEPSSSLEFTWDAKGDQVTIAMKDANGEEDVESYGKLTDDTLIFKEKTGEGEDDVVELTFTKQGEK